MVLSIYFLNKRIKNSRGGNMLFLAAILCLPKPYENIQNPYPIPAYFTHDFAQCMWFQAALLVK